MLKVLLQMMAAIRTMGHSGTLVTFRALIAPATNPLLGVDLALGWGVAAPSLVAVATMPFLINEV